MKKSLITFILISLIVILSACTPQSQTNKTDPVSKTTPSTETSSQTGEVSSKEDSKENSKNKSQPQLDAQREYVLSTLKQNKDKTLTDDKRELSTQVNDVFYINVMNTPIQNGISVSNQDSINISKITPYVEDEKSKTLIEVAASEKGEHFLQIEFEDGKLLSYQIFALDHTNTEGNILELQGSLESVQADSILIRSGEKTHSIYAPAFENIDNLELGSPVLVGVEVGETSYKLKFIVAKQILKSENALPIIQHIVKIQSVQEDQIQVLWNSATLNIYHNDLLASEVQENTYLYVEYEVDKINEANELLTYKVIQ